jgi:GntR family transcriptional regulator
MPSGRATAYRQIADDILAKIRSGELRAGDRLPSTSELMARYKVAKTTVAAAMDALRASGAIVTRQGAGAFVREFRTIRRSSPRRLARQRWESGQMIQDADTSERTRVVDVVVTVDRAPGWVTVPLGLEPDDDVLSRSRRFMVDDRPVQLATSYYPADLARGTAIALTDTGPGGAYNRLADLGQGPTHFTEYLRSRMPTAAETQDLALPAGTPVLEITRHAFTAEDRCVEVNRMILDGSSYVVDYSFTA